MAASRLAECCDPVKVVSQYIEESKPKRTQRKDDSLAMSFQCKQLLRNLFLYLKKNIADPQKRAVLPKFRYFANLASAFKLREVQIQSWGYALYSALVDEQLYVYCLRNSSPVDFASVEDIILKFAIITAIQHEQEMPGLLISRLQLDLRELQHFYYEIQDKIDDPIKHLYAWKLISRENIHRDEQSESAAQSDRKGRVYDYNKTVEELATQDISKRNLILANQAAAATFKMPQKSSSSLNLTKVISGNKRRHN